MTAPPRDASGRTRPTSGRPSYPGEGQPYAAAPRRPRPGGPAGPVMLADPARRLGIGLVVLMLVLGALGVRLVQLQGLLGTSYAATAEAQRLVTVPLPAARGQILDRSGNALAYSVETRSIVADPTLVEQPGRLALALAPLVGVPADELTTKLSQSGRYVVLARNLTPETAATVMDLGRTAGVDLAGLDTEPGERRVYPSGMSAAQVVGFTQESEESGLAGIESQFDRLLAGTPGSVEYEQGRQGEEIPSGYRSEQAAVPGSSVMLTLDQDLQYKLATSVQAAMGGGASNVQGVILDARTGQVLAMASAPGYDPTDPGATVDLLNNPVVSNVVEPGSVNKVVTMAAALEGGIITPATELVVPDHIAISDVVVHDAWGHDPIDFTATGVLAKSSNVGTLMIAEKVGSQTLSDYLHRFGLGSTTGVELPAESGGILAPWQDWSGSQAGNIPIGQGISMTILQMASMYQTIANDGVRVPPTIVGSTITPDGTVTAAPAPHGTRAISTSTAADLQYMLEAVTGTGGTAPKAAIDGYRVAGKTGTAQRPNPECSCYSGGGYWATFAGFAPADDPQYVMAISIEEPADSAEGGQVAAPIFHDVMGYALAHNGIVPSGTPRPDFRLTLG